MNSRGAHNLTIASTLIDQLVAAGIEELVASPGFRNSPLIFAAQNDRRLRVHTVVDERSAAFFALGIAKATRKPAVVCCTSGTALGNYFPAFLEAAHSQTPLVAITADRPAELIGLGSNQTMDQRNLFGVHSRHSLSIATNAIENFDFNWLRYSLGKALHYAEFPNPGPVHINIAFAEPLLPKPLAGEFLPKGEMKKFTEPKPLLDKSVFSEIFENPEEALLVLGNSDFSDIALDALLFSAEKMGVLLLAEASTGILARVKGSPATTLCTDFDALLEIEKQNIPLKKIVRFGAPPVHKNLPEFLSQLENAQHFVFDFHGEARDPALAATTYFGGEPSEWSRALGDFCRERTESKPSDFARSLRKKAAPIEAMPLLSEKSAMAALLSHLPEGVKLFLGNSLSIRDFNRMDFISPRYTRIFHNRGLSGIDGLIATAAGVASAAGEKVVLVLGDLSAQHDIGSLASASSLSDGASLKIIVINNYGGGIFRNLPLPKESIEWFTTPQNIDFAKAAGAFGLEHRHISSLIHASKILDEFFSCPNSGLLEFRVGR